MKTKLLAGILALITVFTATGCNYKITETPDGVQIQIGNDPDDQLTTDSSGNLVFKDPEDTTSDTQEKPSGYRRVFMADAERVGISPSMLEKYQDAVLLRLDLIKQDCIDYVASADDGTAGSVDFADLAEIISKHFKTFTPYCDTDKTQDISEMALEVAGDFVVGNDTSLWASVEFLPDSDGVLLYGIGDGEIKNTFAYVADCKAQTVDGTTKTGTIYFLIEGYDAYICHISDTELF